MDTLYHQTNRVIQEIQQHFQLLNSPQANELEVANQIQTKIVSVKANCDRLDVLLFKVPVSQRPNAKMRVDQLKYDVRHLENALNMWQQKKQKREMEASAREQLLNRRFTSNQETAIDLADAALDHNNSLMNAHQGVDEMMFTGSSILDSLRSQRETLKGARKRILDIGNTLGLSNHTMRLIEKRLSEDKYILYGGMFVTLLVIVLIIYFFVF
ncbi:unnamed protein product [Hermetia illucens]|uniref:Golgi SNAP receptor complex member 2 n=1 Tax=Hermetia illucens TaxID=343691 RepID=A0A7R8V6D7_HERIL|nr:probable Golgi SNAP receptor complex member 2 [Hermetia illucens]CAD7092917.1 unnamed protein product [Hermetia illucens]